MDRDRDTVGSSQACPSFPSGVDFIVSGNFPQEFAGSVCLPGECWPTVFQSLRNGFHPQSVVLNVCPKTKKQKQKQASGLALCLPLCLTNLSVSTSSGLSHKKEDLPRLFSLATFRIFLIPMWGI